MPFTFGEEELNLDDSIMGSCSVTKGDLPLKLWWTFKGVDDEHAYNLTTTDGIMVTKPSAKMSVLGIEAVKARHRGNYTCHAQNRAGVAQQSAYLAIHGSI